MKERGEQEGERGEKEREREGEREVNGTVILREIGGKHVQEPCVLNCLNILSLSFYFISLCPKGVVMENRVKVQARLSPEERHPGLKSPTCMEETQGGIEEVN